MNRNQAKELLPIIKAFSEGKVIQMKTVDKGWQDIYFASFDSDPKDYRIKPEPEYRPFKNAEECWQEMQKHQPFGWVKLINNKEQEEFIHCGVITKADGVLTAVDETPFPYDAVYKNYNFADGTPFGILEEK